MTNEKLQEAIDLLYECRDMLALYDGRHAELYEKVWKWCQANRNAAHVNEPEVLPKDCVHCKGTGSSKAWDAQKSLSAKEG